MMVLNELNQKLENQRTMKYQLLNLELEFYLGDL